MRYTLAGDDWLASTMRAGASSTSSAVRLPTSTTVPILSPVAAVPSAASAAPRRSSAATVTLIRPVYGEPPLVMFVPGSNVTVALPVFMVVLRAGNVPVWRRIAAESVPLTVVSVLLGPITVTVGTVTVGPVPGLPSPSPAPSPSSADALTAGKSPASSDAGSVRAAPGFGSATIVAPLSAIARGSADDVPVPPAATVYAKSSVAPEPFR